MEVAQIARSIAAMLNNTIPELAQDPIDLDIVEFAGLAHDLGHPPFGHQGEAMLDYLMLQHGGYEGNAQTLRILTELEKKGFEKPGVTYKMYDPDIVGLNLTARTLASILKYDEMIPHKRPVTKESHPLKAYYGFDENLVKWIKLSVVGKGYRGKFKTVECQIMDLADDIAYSTYDLEDGLKAGFYTLFDVLYAPNTLREKIAKRLHGKKTTSKHINEVGETLQYMFYHFVQPPPELKEVATEYLKKKDEDPFQHIDLLGLLGTNSQHELSQQYSKEGYARSFMTATLVDDFINGIEFKYNSKHPALSKVSFKKETYMQVEVLKKFTFMSQIESVKMKVSEIRGQEIVNTIFETIAENHGSLLPEDFKYKYDQVASHDETGRLRVICDFIAGMTDRYAIEFYARLKSENAETIFKPL